MSQKTDYSLHSKKTHHLFIPLIGIVLAALFIISLFLWPAVITVILGLLALNALAGLAFGSRMHDAKTRSAKMIAGTLDRNQGGHILDIGAGTGILTIRLAKSGYQVTGIDLDAGALARARNNAEIEGVDIDFHESDGSSLKWPQDSFDGITSLNLLHETKNPLQVLKESYRLLKPGGILAMADMRRGPATFSVFWFGFFKFLSKKKLYTLLDSTGFSDIHISRATTFHQLIVARKGDIKKDVET